MTPEEKARENLLDGGDKFEQEIENWTSNEIERLTVQFRRAYPECDRPTVRGLKVRGSYSSYKLAKKRADRLKEDDESFNIFIGEVGKWCPFNPVNINDVKPEYQNSQLNEIVHSHIKQAELTKQHYNDRKAALLGSKKVMARPNSDAPPLVVRGSEARIEDVSDAKMPPEVVAAASDK
jgi:hypothetical protein